MSKAYEGVLLTCDAPIRQYILHLDEQQQSGAGAGADSFVILSDLDDGHLLVKEEAVEMIQRKVEELQASNSFSRVPEAAAAAAEKEDRPAKKGRKRKEEAS